MKGRREVCFFSVCIGLVGLLVLSRICFAEVSVNIPLGHWSYGALDKLASVGLINSGLLTTRPFTRLEMARLVREAQANFLRSKDKGDASWDNIVSGVLGRLQEELRTELEEFQVGTSVSTYVKPLENVYATFYSSDEEFSFEYDKGREYSDGISFKAGASAHAVLFNHLGFYINPEFRYSDGQFASGDYRVSLVEGYGKLEWWNIELEAGRDSLWWGPGHHGSLILTDNARPFELIKISNPRPVLLPWFLRYMGLFKFVAFWTKLEGNRYVPEAEFMGMRVNIKPFTFLELGASRTILLGGRGPAAPKGAEDLSLGEWWKQLVGKELSTTRELDTDQIGGFDFLIHLNVDKYFRKLRTLDIWGELYGEDEAASLPSKNGFVLGMKLGDIFLTGQTNLVIEHADNVINQYPSTWYNHSVYKSGYTYYKRIMGHDMGSDARDTFISLEHYLRPELILKLGYDYQKRGAQSETPEARHCYDLGLIWWQSEHCFLQSGYRHESIDDMDHLEKNDRNNNILWFSINYSL